MQLLPNNITVSHQFISATPREFSKSKIILNVNVIIESVSVLNI